MTDTDCIGFVGQPACYIAGTWSVRWCALGLHAAGSLI